MSTYAKLTNLHTIEFIAVVTNNFWMMETILVTGELLLFVIRVGRISIHIGRAYKRSFDCVKGDLCISLTTFSLVTDFISLSKLVTNKKNSHQTPI